MVIISGNKIDDSTSILDEAVCLSPHANVLGKGMNSSLLPLAMSK